MTIRWRDPVAVLHPKSVAIAGASPESRWARRLFLNLEEGGYPGRVHLVNPRYDSVWDQRCYATLSEIPEVPDTVYVLVPAEHNLTLLQEAARLGSTGAVVFAAGYAEQGNELGRERQEALAQLAHDTGIRIVGPNCFGCVSAPQRLWAYPQSISVLRGHLGIVAQSGGAVGTLLRGTGDRAVGVSYAISSGNEADLDLADYLHFFAASKETHVIALFLEGIRDPEKFIVAVEECLRADKPVLAVKVGRTAGSRQGALSHTGALTGSDSAFDAVCKQYGIIRCADLNELLETAIGFLPRRWSEEPAVAGLTISGGQMSVLPDLAEASGVPLASLSEETRRALEALVPARAIANPLDSSSVGFTNQESYTRIAETLLHDPAVGCLVMQGDQFLSGDAPLKPEVWARLGRALKPVLFFSRGYYSLGERERAFQTAVGGAFIQGPYPALRVARKLNEYARRRARFRSETASTPPPVAQPMTGHEKLVGVVGLGGLSATFERAGLSLAPYVYMESLDGAIRAAANLDYPIVLKLETPDAPHKLEAGLVRLPISSADELRRAGHEMEALASAKGMRAAGWLAQQVVFDGAEFIIGATRDPQFGLVIMLGQGGTHVERWGRVTHRMGPVSRSEVDEMLAELGAGLSGEYDWSALTEMTTRFAHVAAWLLAEPADEFEVNPVMVRRPGQGAVILDARLIRHRSATRRSDAMPT